MAQTEVEPKSPEDKYHLVYLTLVVHGIGILMPWNMFITARSYFVDHKMSKEYTGEETNYATYFLSYVGFASNISNLIFNWISVFVNGGFRGNVTPRIVTSICIEIFIVIMTIILASTDSRSWSHAFFWCTMISVVILNMASAVYQNILFGLAAKLPSKYPGALILGCNVSGTLVSLIELLSVAIAPEIDTAAIYYFSIALIVLLVCLVTYFLLPHIRFYSYHALLKKSPQDGTANQSQSSPLPPPALVPYWLIFRKAALHLFNVFFTFFVTLSVFPAMQAGIRKSDPEFFVSEKYYENIMCFLTFNMAAMAGSFVSNWINWPTPKVLLFLVILRTLFIPFFFFCNFQPTNKERNAPVLVSSDWLYWAGGVLFGLTSGYYSCKALLHSTTSVETAHASVVGMLGAAVIVTGIFCGVLLSLAFPPLAEL